MNRSRFKHWLVPVLILITTLLAYQPVMNAGFIWDDDDYVTQNTALHDWQGLVDIWTRPGTTRQYYPLVFTSFWLEYQLWQLEPSGYHVVNVVIHAVNAILLWLILLRLNVPGAWLAAALFALHPVQVESVAWITERKNTLSLCFYLLAGLAYLRFDPLGNEPRRTPRFRWGWYVSSLLCFIAALLCKTVTATFPAAVLLVTWWKRSRIQWREAVPLLSFFVFALSFAAVTIHMEKAVVGATGADWELSLLERFLVAGRAIWFYSGKLFWPAGLTFNYPRWSVSGEVLWQQFYPLAVIAVILLLLHLRNRIGRGPAAAVLFFAGSLTPALGFFDVYPFIYSFVADHFQYHAGIGLIALAGAAILNAGRPRLNAMPVRIAAGILLSATLGVLTWHQAHSYQNPESLWLDTLAKNERSWLATSHLGGIYQDQGRIEQAVRMYERTLELHADEAYTLNRLAIIYMLTGKTDEAMALYDHAIAVRPDYEVTYSNLGAAYYQLGEYGKSLAALTKAIELAPDYIEAYNKRAICYWRMEEYEKAQADLEKFKTLGGQPDPRLEQLIQEELIKSH